jgi:hypothetical protein
VGRLAARMCLTKGVTLRLASTRCSKSSDRSSINGKSAEERLTVRRKLSRPRVDDLDVYMIAQVAKLSRGHDLVKAINYLLILKPLRPTSHCSHDSRMFRST